MYYFYWWTCDWNEVIRKELAKEIWKEEGKNNGCEKVNKRKLLEKSKHPPEQFFPYQLHPQPWWVF